MQTEEKTRPAPLLERLQAIRLRDLRPMPHQVRAAAGILRGNLRIIADEQGCGKTFTAIMAAVESGKRVFVTGPKTLAAQWETDLAATGFAVQVLRTGKDRIDPAATAIFIPTTSLLTRFRVPLAEWCHDAFVIVDEGHSLKTRGAKRTKAVYGEGCAGKGGIIEHAAHVVAMSGTPAPNHNGELWTHLRALAPEAIAPPGTKPMKAEDFEKRFCLIEPTRIAGGSTVDRIVGSRNTGELRDWIMPYVSRTKLTEVTEFPAERHEVLRFACEDLDVDALAAIAQVADPDLRDRLVDIERAAKLDAGAATTAAAALLKELGANSEHLAHIRRALGMAKIPAIEDIVSGRPSEARPVLIFNTYSATGDALQARLQAQGIGVARIYGATPDKAREAAVAAIQNREVAAAVLQITAAGAGLNLQSADRIIMLEPSWVPGENAQAVSRAVRMGQDTSVLVSWPVIKDSLDEAVLRALRRKEEDIKNLLGGQKNEPA